MIDHVIDVSRGDKKLSEYLESGMRVLIVFFHGVGDTVMFQVVFDHLRKTYPDIHFDLGLCRGLDQETIFPDSVLLEADWREKFDTLGYDIVFSCNFPMSEGQTALTKSEWCCIKELGIDPVWGHNAIAEGNNRLVGVHYQITCLPDSANVPIHVAEKIWNEIKESGHIPMETLMRHVFHNPVNEKYHFINRDLRDAFPRLSTLAHIISSCKAFICCVSGNFHIALSVLPPERICLIERDFKLECFTKLPVKKISVDEYSDGMIKDWLDSF